MYTSLSLNSQSSSHYVALAALYLPMESSLALDPQRWPTMLALEKKKKKPLKKILREFQKSCHGFVGKLLCK